MKMNTLFNSKGNLITLFFVMLLVLVGCDARKEEIKSIDDHNTVNIQEWKTNNGVRVLYVYAPELPMIDVQVVFDAGSIRDGEKPGIANLTNKLISHGAKVGDKILTVDDVSERFENIGARFGISASKDNAKITLRTLTDDKLLNKAVSTMRAIINAPTFDEKEVKRVRKEILIGIEGRKQSPGTIASETYYKELYGKHPYAKPTIGLEGNIKKLTRDDLIGFYKKYYVASNALLTIVGDVDKAKALGLAEQVVGNLPTGEKATSLSAVNDLTMESSKHYEFPSSQTHVLIGQVGVNRKDKDYFTLYVANHILGGSGFGSRIMEEIREKRGLAYSSYSYFLPMLKRGPFIMGMQTSNKHTIEAVKVLKETLKTFVDKGPTEKELMHSKKNITGGFPLRIDSNSDISKYLAVIGFYNLPLSYLKDFNNKIEDVTLQQIKETVKRRIDPEKMLTVTVGRQE